MYNAMEAPEQRNKKLYMERLRKDKGLKLSDNVKLVLINLKVEILIYMRGGGMAPIILRAIMAKFWTKSAVFHGTNHWSMVFAV